jgi:putative transcriptional regulator
MNRAELLKLVRDILSNAGFYVSEVYSMRPIGFDLVARRDNSLLIIKVLSNINSLPEDVAEEIKKLASLLRGHPLLIGLRTGNGLLEDEVVYDRFGIQAINLETLSQHLLDGIPLKVYAAPGGFYVNLEREKLIKLREKHQISLGSFARSINVSRRTIRMYEDGMNARIDIAYRIEDLFQERLIKQIDILKNSENKDKIKENNDTIIREISIKNDKFKYEIFHLLKELGYTIIPMGRAPFEAVTKDREKIILTCVQKYDTKLLRKAQVVNSISKITEKKAVMFTDKKGVKNNIEGTPLIIKEELKKLKDPEDIIELIIERIIS